jgi:hypothetical protein
MQDIAEQREPTLVIPIIVNQSVEKLKSKNFHECFSHIPSELLIFVEKFECPVVNVHSIAQDALLKMSEDNLLRSLFLAYQAIENPDSKDDILIEIFKFIKEKQYLTTFFQPLLAFIIKKGDFTENEVKQMLDYYLTPQQLNNMTVRMSLGDRLEARGEARGEKRRAHLTVLRGYFKGYPTDELADLSGLSKNEVLVLEQGYEKVKTAWQKKEINIPSLANDTTLTEEEVKYVLSCVESILMA